MDEDLHLAVAGGRNEEEQYWDDDEATTADWKYTLMTLKLRYPLLLL